jgi:protein-S-isoprenylcysteine O-methyltransferase Ste14
VLVLGIYFALQCAFIWARFAIFRIQGAKPFGVRIIEISTLGCIAVGVALVLDRTIRLEFDIAASLVGATSAAIFAWSLRSVSPLQLTAAFSDDVPVQLIRSGPYRYIRNPFYLAYLLAHGMPLLASGSAWGLVTLGWMVGLYGCAALVEERKFLRSALAEDYRRYVRETGRFLPRFRA